MKGLSWVNNGDEGPDNYEYKVPSFSLECPSRMYVIAMDAGGTFETQLITPKMSRSCGRDMVVGTVITV